MSLELIDKDILILGMGISGRSAAEFLIAQGAIVHGVDRDQKLLETNPDILSLAEKGLILESEEGCANKKFDCLVLSPGIPLTHPLLKKFQQEHLPIIGEIELGCQMAKNPVIGITGTNGKTTVTLLVEHVLQKSGIQAAALGNVGIPFTKNLLTLTPDKIIVLELSSYQIETLSTPILDAGLILNITPDHLDRYGEMEPYANAKCRLENCLKPNGHLYVSEKAWEGYGHLLKEKPRLYGYLKTSYIHTDLQKVFRDGKEMFELPLPLQNRKSHEVENFLAAYSICAERGVRGEEFLQGFETFNKPKHRIEFVKEHQGVFFYDDSKGTNIDAVTSAVQSLDRLIILIAGGVDKGASYRPWIKEFKNKVKSICAIGQAADKISQELTPQIPVTIFKTLEEAVREAARVAVKGDIVLLSPGCSSFDMFKDYAHRGEEFQRIVQELGEVK